MRWTSHAGSPRWKNWVWLFKQSHAEVCWTVLRGAPSSGVCLSSRAGWTRQSMKAANTTYDTINISVSSQATHGRIFSKIITLWFYWAWFSPHALLLTSRSGGGSLTGWEDVISNCARFIFNIQRIFIHWKGCHELEDVAQGNDGIDIPQSVQNCVGVVLGTWYDGEPGSAGLMVWLTDVTGPYQP